MWNLKNHIFFCFSNEKISADRKLREERMCIVVFIVCINVSQILNNYFETFMSSYRSILKMFVGKDMKI